MAKLTSTDPNEWARQALRGARAYRGTRRGDDDLFAPLVALQNYIWNEKQKPNAAPDLETQFLRAALGDKAEGLNSLLDIMDIAVQARDQSLHTLFNSAAQGEHDFGDLVIVQHPQVFVPPDRKSLQKGDGTGTVDAPKFEPRLTRLLGFLSDQEIKIDDLVIYEGIVDDTSMRQSPYYIVDILSRGVQVAVCDQVGNATFISQKRMIPAEWAMYSKPELESLPHIRRIEDHGTEKWLTDVWDAITTSNAPSMDEAGIKEEQKRARRETAPRLNDAVIWRDQLYHLQEKRKWAGERSGPVLSRPGDDWKKIQGAGQQGGRGLQKGRTLAVIVRDRVIAAMDKYKEMYGNDPTREITTPPVPEYPQITWAMMEDGFTGNTTTSLAMLRTGKDLTEDMVWHDQLYHLKEKGEWAGEKSGSVLSRPGDDWRKIQGVGQQGGRGLQAGRTPAVIVRDRVIVAMDKYKEMYGNDPTREITTPPVPEYPQITWAMMEDGFTGNTTTSLAMLRTGKDLTEDMVWHDQLYHLKEKGEWARNSSGAVLNRPGDDWYNVDAVGQAGGRGLQKGRTLAVIVRDRVIAAMDKYKEMYGNDPTREITTPPVPEYPQITWAMMEDGFTGNTTTSLAMLRTGKDLTEDMVWHDQLYHLKEKGEWARNSSGPVLNRPGDDWRNIQVAGQQEGRGLQKGRTLVVIVRDRVTALCRTYHQTNGLWPWQTDMFGLFDTERNISWRDAMMACLVNAGKRTPSMFRKSFTELDPNFVDPFRPENKGKPAVPAP